MKNVILGLLLCLSAYSHAEDINSVELGAQLSSKSAELANIDNIVKNSINKYMKENASFSFINKESLLKWLDYKIEFMENLILLNLKNNLGKVEFNSYQLNYTIIKKQDPLFLNDKNSPSVEDVISKSHMVVTDFKYVESSISKKTPYISSAYQVDDKPVEYVKSYIETGLNFRVVVFPAPNNKEKVVFLYSFILSDLDSLRKATSDNITIELPTLSSISIIGEAGLELGKEITIFKSNDYELLVEIVPTTSIILETPVILKDEK